MDEPYGARLAEIYDLVYTSGRNKDYAAEAAALADLVHTRNPRAASILDVACGTGEHLKYLREFFPDAEGLELAEPMRAKALAKLPDVTVHAGDIRDFTLGRVFDVVACMFSSIGYVRSIGELHAAVKAMAGHLGRGGVLVIDPWFHPDSWQGGHLDHTVAIGHGRKVLRLARSARRGRTSSVVYDYLVGDGDGVTHFTDVHEMSLFTRDEYTDAVIGAGCDDVKYVEGWAAGRGRIVAVKA
jgi:SAM-dependent methyltransferase